MSTILDFWALLNTLVIMFALGLAAERHGPEESETGTLLRTLLGYNLLMPALILIVIKTTDWFSASVLEAMTLCIAAAGGTSAGAFVTQVKGSPVLAGKLIVLLLGSSLAAIAVFSQMKWIQLGSLSLGYLAVYLLAITLLPLFAGRTARRYAPTFSMQWQPKVERAGSLLVILLVVALAVRYGREILTGPLEPMLAALALVLMFALPPLLERNPVRRRTIALVTLIRNLTLVLSMLAVLPQAPHLLPTVLAFGLFMYIATGVLVWRWRKAN